VKYDRTHPVWEQACVAAMQGMLASEQQTARWNDSYLTDRSITLADRLTEAMNKALEETTTTEKEPCQQD
jgi:hypothetical protein